MGASKGYYSRQEHIQDIMSQLKKIAVDKKSIVVSISQVYRSYNEKDNRPKIESLAYIRDFTHIDKITLLYREEYYSKHRSDNRLTGNEIIEFINSKKTDLNSKTTLAVIDQKTLRIYD